MDIEAIVKKYSGTMWIHEARIRNALTELAAGYEQRIAIEQRACNKLAHDHGFLLAEREHLQERIRQLSEAHAMSDIDKMREALLAAKKIIANPHGYTDTSVLVAEALIGQAAQAVPVVGEVVENAAKSIASMVDEWVHGCIKNNGNWQESLPALIQLRLKRYWPTTSINAAELERLRKDEELKASEASIACEALQAIIDLLPDSSVAQAKLIAVAAMTKRAATRRAIVRAAAAIGEGMK